MWARAGIPMIPTARIGHRATRKALVRGWVERSMMRSSVERLPKPVSFTGVAMIAPDPVLRKPRGREHRALCRWTAPG